jgi:hypothetical protein
MADLANLNALEDTANTTLDKSGQPQPDDNDAEGKLTSVTWITRISFVVPIPSITNKSSTLLKCRYYLFLPTLSMEREAFPLDRSLLF